MPENFASYFLLRCFKSASRCLDVRSWRSRGTLPVRNGDFQKVKTSLSSNGSIGSLIRRHFLEEMYVIWTEPDLSGLNSSKAKKRVKQLLERWEGERGYRKRLPSGRCTVNWQRVCVQREGSRVDFLLFYFMPRYEALLRPWGGNSLTSDGLLQSVWFPWHKTTTDNWPGSHGPETWKHSVPADMGRKVQWWLLSALLINVKPGSTYHRRGASAPRFTYVSFLRQVFSLCQY